MTPLMPSLRVRVAHEQVPVVGPSSAQITVEVGRAWNVAHLVGCCGGPLYLDGRRA